MARAVTEKAFWQQAQQLFEAFLALLGLVAPEVLLAAGEMLTAYASDLCLAAEIGVGRQAEICAQGAVRGSDFFDESRKAN